MSKEEITGQKIYNLQVKFVNKDKTKAFIYPHRIKFYENENCGATIIMPNIWFEHQDLDKYVADLEAKLAEFEYFMEEQGFESLEKLKEFIELQETNIRFYSRISEENSNKNQALKDRWQKLKEYITNEFNYDKENIRMVGKDYGYGCINTEEDILAKMQELEKEIK